MADKTFNYEIGPVQSMGSRKVRNKFIFRGELQAKNIGTATQIASEKADEATKEHGFEFGVIRVY